MKRELPSCSLVLVSGLSGSGKSIALKVLEDAGYYCVDNLPATLLARGGRLLCARPGTNASPSASTRAARRWPRCRSTSPSSSERGVDCRVLYLEANTPTPAAPLLRNAPPPSAGAATARRCPRPSSASARCSPTSRRSASASTPATCSRACCRTGSATCSASDPARSRCCSSRSPTGTACRSTPTGCSTAACCPTRTTTRSCGRSPGATRR